MSMNKLERKRYNNKLCNRRYRARKAELADAQQQVDIEPYTPAPPTPQPPRYCKTCGEPASFSLQSGIYCHTHGAELANRPAAPALPAASAVDLPTAFSSVPRPERNLFDPASDKFRPAWWAVVDPDPKPIEISLSPRTVARSNRRPLRADPGIVFTEADGHIDIAARQDAIEELKRRDTGR